jgi:hypothetical protein
VDDWRIDIHRTSTWLSQPTQGLDIAMKGTSKHRWLLFSIRDLAWFTLLCGVLITWWLDRGALIEEVQSVDIFRRRVSAEAKVAKAELDKAVESNRVAQGAIPEAEIKRLTRRYTEAKSLADVAENVDSSPH